MGADMSAHPSSRHVLSKSSFIRGCQCPKSLYLYKHFYKTRDPLSPAQRAIFARGTNVGLLARELFPSGSDASPPTPFQYARSVRDTAALIASGTPVIYEAAFRAGGVLAAMDILLVEPGAGSERVSLRAFEVKSSTAVSDTYLLDAALQYWVITKSGYEVSDISIVHIDPSYRRSGALDPTRLFRSDSVLDAVLERQPYVEEKVEELIAVVGRPEVPDVEIGPHCNDPYPCDFRGTCWREVPSYSVFDIARLPEERKFELYRRGVREVAEVPADFPLTERQRLQVEAARSGEATIDRGAIRSFLSDIDYPRLFVDFETFQPAVPLYDDSAPYQQIPFQFSLHRVASPESEAEHVEYLAEAGPDPRREFIERLLEAIGREGAVVVYNRSFEATRLAELARDFPAYDERLSQVVARMVDLIVPFRDLLYYRPEMHGSSSIKQVLPALVPELSYDGLRIKDGTMASITFERLIGEEDRRRRGFLRRQLRDYCKLDSLAMVKIVEALEAEADEGTSG